MLFPRPPAAPRLPLQITCTVVALAASLLPVAAAEPDGSHVEQVVVTGTRTNTRLIDMPLYTTVISREEVARSPAQTLDQLLRQVPGINLGGAPAFTTDPTGHQAKMRGVSNSKVLVLLDGVPIHDPFYGTIEWYKVPLSAVDHIEVIRGGNSSLWGNLAVAGVINIVSRQVTDNSGVLSASYGSLNTFNGALLKNFLISDAFSLSLSADVLSSDGYQTTPQAFLTNLPGKGKSATRNENLRLAAYFKPAPDIKAHLKLGLHRQDQDIGGYQYGSNLQKSPDMIAGLSKTFADRSMLTANLWAQYVDFDKSNGAGCYLQANRSTCNTTAPSPDIVQYFAQHDDNTYRELGSSLIYSTRIASILPSLQFGFDYRAISGKDAATVYNVPTGPSVANASVNREVYGQGAQQFAGLFTQLTWRPLSQLETTLSARVDRWRNTDGVARLTKYTAGVPGSPSERNVPDSSITRFDPSLALRYAASDDIAVRGAVYKAFRAPGLNNLYRTFASSTSITIANPDLAPENLKGWEIGADGRWLSLSLSATYFHYAIDNMVTSYKVASVASAPTSVLNICGNAAFGSAASNCPGTVNFNSNGQNGIARGIELNGDWKMSEAWSANAAYVRTDSYYTATSTGEPTGTQLGGVPRNVATLGLDWQPPSRLHARAELRYTGSLFLDIARSIPQSAFTTLNLSANYQASKDLELFAALVNATDRQYADNATTNASSQTLGMPRTFSAGLKIRF